MVHKRRDITEEFNRGTNLYLKGKRDDAINYFKKLIRKYPEMAEPHIALGVIYFNERDIKDAIKEFSIALKLNPKNPLIHNNLGNIYEAIGDKEKAISEYKKAVEIDPNFSLGHTSLSLIYEKMGKIEEAFNELKEAANNPYGLPDKGLSLFFRLSIYYLIFYDFENSRRMIKKILNQTLFNTKLEIVELRRKCNLILKTIKGVKKVENKERVERIRSLLKEFELKHLIKFLKD